MRNSLTAIAVLAFSSTLIASTIFDVTLNTQPLLTSTAGPFSFGAQFAPGTGDIDKNNTVVLRNFNFGSGMPKAATPTLIGGATGSLASAVQLTDSGFINFFSQQFVPGNQLSFSVDLSTNSDVGGIPDGLAIYILDSSGTPIPTSAGPFADFLLTADTTDNPNLQTFSSDITRSPAAGGNPISFAAPAVVLTSVPEPGTIGFVVIGVAVLLFKVRRGPLASQHLGRGADSKG